MKKVLNCGIVDLIQAMGTDEDIANSARVSYQSNKGKTYTSEDNRKLIEYLYKNRHTSPFEMGEVKFYLKLPIFVMRQLIRHRTASINEASMRYSEATNDFWVAESWRLQDTKNKQSSHGVADVQDDGYIQACQSAIDCYHKLLDAGVCREQARAVLPVAMYTECYWKMDLNNFTKFLILRLDEHAQYEIRVYAQAMYEEVKEKFPMVFGAFEKYDLPKITLDK